MISNGIFNGYRRIVKIKQNFPANALASQTQIPFDEAPALVDGYEASVVGIWVRCPNMQIAMPNAKGYFDAVTMQQLGSAIQIRLAAGCPIQSAPSGNVLVPQMDLYRASFLNTFVTGVNPIAAKKSDLYLTEASNIATGDQTLTLSAVDRLPQQHREIGRLGGEYPQFLGPFGVNDASGTATWSDRMMIYWSFVPDGESWEDWSIPIRWFGGYNKSNGGQSSPGDFSLTLNNKTDGMTVTLGGGTESYDVYFDCYVHPSVVSPIPAVPFLNYADASQSTIPLKAGPTIWAGFLKRIDQDGTAGNGVQVTESYTNVKLLQNGQEIQWDQVADLNDMLQQQIRRPGMKYYSAQSALPLSGFNSSVRLTRAGQPIVAHDEGILTAPGDTSSPLTLQVVITGETNPHRVVSAHLASTSDQIVAAAYEWADIAPAKAVLQTVTANGKKLDGARSGALARRILTSP